MVKTKKGVTATHLSHPNSRKVHQLTKQVKKEAARKKSKKLHQMRQNLLGEKFIWFRDNLPEELAELEHEMIKNLIETYLKRFDEELEQIRAKNSVEKRKNRQHASREDILQLTKLQEEEEYKTCGIELPNLLQQSQLEMLRKWNGELRFLQNFKLRRFSEQFLKTGISKSRPQSPVKHESDNMVLDVHPYENLKYDKNNKQSDENEKKRTNDLQPMETDVEKNKS